MRCAPHAIWIQIMWEGPLSRDSCPTIYVGTLRSLPHWKAATVLRLFLRQRLLPIDHELPRSHGVRLPDLKKMTCLGSFAVCQGVLSVAVREIGRVTCVASHWLERHLPGLRAQQRAGRLLPNRRKTAVAVNADFISAGSQRGAG